MVNKYILLIFINLATLSGISQSMDNIERYKDLSLDYVEPDPAFYDFAYPFNSDILSLDDFNAPEDGAYIAADFGNRYRDRLEASGSYTDNHGGFDLHNSQTYQGVQYDSSNPPPIICMCDGVITRVEDATEGELLERSVQVKCDKISKVFEDNIYTNYRHLASVGELAKEADVNLDNEGPDIRINKGDNIGVMGSGSGTYVHLHLSTQSKRVDNGNFDFVSTARLFDPEKSSFLNKLENAKVELLNAWDDKAAFRIIWLNNQNINQFEFINGATGEQIGVFNKEDAYNTEGDRDIYDVLPGISVYAYAFNGKLTAKDRYDNDKEEMRVEFPASPERADFNENNTYGHYPITENTASYVYDFVIKDIPSGVNPYDFVVKLNDVWGNVVEASFGDTTLGIDDYNLNNNIKIYPNPTTSQISIESDQNIAHIELYTTTGKYLQTLQTKTSNEVLNLDDVSAGLYFLKITLDTGNTETFKVIKK